MVPHVRIEHQIPGRIRLKLPSRKGDRAFFADMTGTLRDLPGVLSVRTNAVTGSVVIEHNAEVATLVEEVERQGLFAFPRGGSGRQTIHLNPLSITAAGFAGLGAVQMARGQYLGSGVENLWNAYSAWATLRMPLLAVAFIGFGLYRIAAGDPLAPGVSLLFYALSAREMARGESDEPAG